MEFQKLQLAAVISNPFTIRVQRPSKEPEQNWKDKMEVKAVLQHYNEVNMEQYDVKMMQQL